MGGSRTLWEIGLDGVAVRELRVRLGLDSGYFSRVLLSLGRQGLITRGQLGQAAQLRFTGDELDGRQGRGLVDVRRLRPSTFGCCGSALRPRTMGRMIEVRELTKRYGGVLPVDYLSFTVPAGRVTGFLGPNGAGKSTIEASDRAAIGGSRPSGTGSCPPR